jgi:hypothetical protein
MAGETDGSMAGETDGVTSAPAYLLRLRPSELLERARALGAHEHVLDELLDHDDPRASLVELICSWRPEDVVLSSDVRQLVAALAAARGEGAKHILTKMVEICGMGSDLIDAEEGRRPPASVHLELAASGVVEVTVQLVAHALATEPHDEGSILREGMLMLATLAAKRECAAWFSGSGAISVIVAAIGRGSAVRSPRLDGVLEADVESLGASALANLAYPPNSEEGSTAVAKEILSMGAATPLLKILPIYVAPPEGAAHSRGRVESSTSTSTSSSTSSTTSSTTSSSSVHAQQWAAAALCNLSMHGPRARQVMIDAGVFSALSSAVTSLAQGEHVATGMNNYRPNKEPAEEEATHGQVDALLPLPLPSPPQPPPEAAREKGRRTVTMQLLLGCLTNLAAFHEEPSTEFLRAGGAMALESAMLVLETAPRILLSALSDENDNKRDDEHPLQEAAISLILQTAESCGGSGGSTGLGWEDTEAAEQPGSESEPSGSLTHNYTDDDQAEDQDQVRAKNAQFPPLFVLYATSEF